MQTCGFESTAIIHIDSVYRFALYMMGRTYKGAWGNVVTQNINNVKPYTWR